MNDLFTAPRPPLVVMVPGEPVAWARAGNRLIKAKDGRQFISHYDPKKVRSWKGAAQVHMHMALDNSQLKAPAFPDGPVQVEIEAIFTQPRSTWRKRELVPRQPKKVRPDIDNLAKALFDAANGILLTDDSQVAELTIRKITGAQEEAPYVQATVRAL
jgi:Holliday junction resolvase RusA-like endonuclease